MIRSPLIIAAASFALTACGPAPDSSFSAKSSTTIQTANQDQLIPVQQIAKDVVKRVVPITEVNGDGTPIEWTFDADEFRRIEIIEQAATGNSVNLVIFMTTHNNPKADEDAVQVSGKLRLHYERSGNKWNLKGIENLSFRFTVGTAT